MRNKLLSRLIGLMVFVGCVLMVVLIERYEKSSENRKDVTDEEMELIIDNMVEDNS